MYRCAITVVGGGDIGAGLLPAGVGQFLGERAGQRRENGAARELCSRQRDADEASARPRSTAQQQDCRRDQVCRRLLTLSLSLSLPGEPQLAGSY